jgi:acetyl esterase/lipase
LRFDPPAKPNGAVVIILGGGGYRHIQMRKEVEPAAAWLKSLDLTPAILRHRLPGDGWSPDAPLQDVSRAIRLIRAKATIFGFNPARIGVLGFSAGGHLAAMAATSFDLKVYEPVDAADLESSRPDFAALVFPVISLSPPYDRTSTRRMLVGDSAGRSVVLRYEPHEHVSANTAPTFLAHAADDPTAAPQHSMLMFDALKRAGVATELHIFGTGGHGMAFGADGSRLADWPRLFIGWARSIGVLNTSAA